MTKHPITTSGWYELTDGRVQRFTWIDGELRSGEIVASWADVPEVTLADVDAADRAYHASKVSQ